MKTRPDDSCEETLVRIVRLLLQGIAQHAIEGDPEDAGAFRASIRKLTISLEGDLAAEELLVQVGSALQTLEDYNRRTARHLKRPAGEWQAVVTMLLSAMSAMLDFGDRNAARLKDIAGRVRVVAELDEVHLIRLQLAECLAELQLENRHQKEPAAAPPPPSKDAVTGFDTRTQAEDALIHAWKTEPPSYVAVMALDRLQIFNLRFGHSVGDEVVRFYGEFLRAHVRPGDRIFRWNDSTLVLLLPRPNRLEIVRDEVARLMELHCEHTVQTASRTILIPITSRWTVFPSMAAPRLLIHKIDAFVEVKAGRDPSVG